MKNKVISEDEAKKSSVDYFNGDELAANVFLTKYACRDLDGNLIERNPNDMHRRMAREFARIEKKYPNSMSEEEIFNLFKNYKDIIPQGSPMSGIGNPNQVQSLSNCFVIENPFDSYGGILKTDQEQVQIMKRRGGVGFDISSIRPRGKKTSNAARTTDGIELFMERFSNSCREVAQGGRRGALMLTISVHHPQIMDFINIKRDLKKVTGANISIRLSDEFMSAVENDVDVELRWPVDSPNPSIVSKFSAKDIWNEIIESAWSSAEPGLLFWGNAKKMTPSDIYADEGFESTSTNPCGEIILSPYDSCRLMVVNLASFVENEYTDRAFFDFERFSTIVRKAQRLMDDMIDLEIEHVDKIIEKIESDPEPDAVKQIEKDLWLNIETQAHLGRRTGLGVTAVGDTLAALGMRYGSPRSIEMIEDIYKNLAINAYRSSCILAKERGAFEVHDHQKEEGHPFLSRIWDAAPDVYEMSKKYGRRNIALTTTAPAGSVSTQTQTTSGIEPAYLLHYKRRRKLTETDETTQVDFTDDLGDKWKEYDIFHHGYEKWMKISGESDYRKSPYFQATSSDIDWVAKVKVQAAAQKWICHAISNTTNVPADTSPDVIKEIYLAGWKSGCKGVTVYRDGSRAGVLVSTDENSKENLSGKNGKNFSSAPKRPDMLECEIHRATIKGEDWTILVGLLDGRPYEIFGGLSEYVEIPKKYALGRIRKRPRKTMPSKYDLIIGTNGDEIAIKDIVKVFDNPNYGSFTRTLSLTLRHGVPIHYIVEQLYKDKDADLFSLARVIARCLKKYIADGTKVSNGVISCECSIPKIVYQEGCAICLGCGLSKCG